MALEALDFIPLRTLNWIGIGVYAFCTLGYHWLYAFISRRHPLSTVKGKVERYRKDWVENILQTRNIIMAVQAIRNHIMATTWLAGSVLLVLAFFLTSGIRSEGVFAAPSEVFQALGIVDQGFLRIKIDLLLVVFGFAFLAFLFAIRHMVLLNILIGTSPELITQVEGVEASEYLAQLLNRGHSRFTWGLRATYFSLPVIGWLFSPWAFVILTVTIWLWVLLVLDTRSPVAESHHPRR